MALALYRRYRPDTFDGVIGQDQVTVPLSRALDQGKITHAYLFSGPRGCGKTSSARILARCINCEKGPTSHPCGECQSCKDLATGGSGSIDVVEIDAASHNGVDDARELRERAGFAPARDRYKIFILDEAHMVTPQGFNALLKIVEEPPEHVMFIFATTEPDKVIGTIRSRTHHYPFRLVPPEVMGPYLEDVCKKEGILPDPGVLRLAMRAGAGSMRDTLSVLDQLMVGAVDGSISLDSAVALLGFTPSALISEAIDAIIEHDGAAAYDVVRRVVVGGYDTRKFVEDLLGRVRDLLLMVSAGTKAASDLLNDIAPEDLQTLQSQSSKLTLQDLARMAQTINDSLSGMANAVSPRMNLEILVARLLADSEFAGKLVSQVAVNQPVNQPVNQVANQVANQITNQITNQVTNQATPKSHFIGSSSSNAVNSGVVNSGVANSSAANSSDNVSRNTVLRDTSQMWDEVVSKLPEDVREYVTQEYVPKVELSELQANKQRLVLTFNEPMSQHAFALAVCTTSPYEGQKVPKVVMNVVRDVFGSTVTIAPAPVAANGEKVESVARMDPKSLAKVKRDILLRKTGISAGFGGKFASGSGGTAESQPAESQPVESQTTESKIAESQPSESIKEKDSSDFRNADGSAASVVADNTAEDFPALPDVDVDSSDDDAWADMSSVPIADVMSMQNSGSSANAPESMLAAVTTAATSANRAESTFNAASPNPQNNQDSSKPNISAGSPDNLSSHADSSSSVSPSSPAVAATPASGASADECSMDDVSLESATSVSDDELKQMFEVKTVEEFSASDPKNPKNAISATKKKQEE